MPSLFIKNRFAMTKETLEKANRALANLEAHKKFLATIKDSGAIAIGPANEVTASSTRIIGGHYPINHHFAGGMIIGMKSDFLANPKIRELCEYFHEKLVSILEVEVALQESIFENL